ncbi:Integrase core domain [Pseudocitrobacter vendiensis]|uniref:Integrase core domain n=1 Tax=Pseudocitrobacter vendiensis TaxID=2488306 RepID=A0ABN8T789_9ENTR|nr:Integrase core domain [Pseudocitrobacter vendiensis]
MTMDNGSPWGDTTGTWTALELWLMRQGIRVGHSRPYHLQTQGKWFTDSGELQRAFDHWRTVYNLERPHEALGMAVPTSRYQRDAEHKRYQSKCRQSVQGGAGRAEGDAGGWLL